MNKLKKIYISNNVNIWFHTGHKHWSPGENPDSLDRPLPPTLCVALTSYNIKLHALNMLLFTEMWNTNIFPVSTFFPGDYGKKTLALRKKVFWNNTDYFRIFGNTYHYSYIYLQVLWRKRSWLEAILIAIGVFVTHSHTSN